MLWVFGSIFIPFRCVLCKMGEVYKPSEDSYLLQKYVETLVSGIVLDMGTGSGIQAISAALKDDVSRVLAVDINPGALMDAQKKVVSSGVANKIEFELSDLFDSIEGYFDWIIFNAPYLPSEGESDEASWAGGETGKEISMRFLHEAKSYLSFGGSILFVYSSHTGLMSEDFNGYNVEVLEEIGVFFEKIYCVRLNPS